ncbi:sulfotransferase 1C4-like [Macrobrachium nipponense]|uniref:sulfotransferase 1C4-like n=1 Tax=Macrobrachium nipponense TaxID=159736 RepID=UPI0030C85415
MGIILDRLFPGAGNDENETVQLESGHTLEPLTKEEMERQNRDWKGYPYGLVRVTPGRWVFPKNYKYFADRIYKYQPRKTDVFVMTFPKCGTTWTQEIVWTMRNNPDLNHPQALEFVLARSPFLDMDMLLHKPEGLPPLNDPLLKAFLKLCPFKNPFNGLMLQMSEAIPDPRTIKTHLPFSLLNPSLLDTSKVVYVARNPKDVIVSYHHHCRINKVHDFVGSFEEFVQYFVEDDLVYGAYWLHVKEAWEKRDHPNLHIVFFEDLKAKPVEELRKLNTFLETNLSEAQLEGIAKYTSFTEMKARALASGFNEENFDFFNKDVVRKDGGFFRKGESGDWKGKFTPELEDKVNKWTQENMTSFGIDFKYGV